MLASRPRVTRGRRIRCKRGARPLFTHTLDDGARPAVRPSLAQVCRHRAAGECVASGSACALGQQAWSRVAVTVTHTATSRRLPCSQTSAARTHLTSASSFCSSGVGRSMRFALRSLTPGQPLTSRTERRALFSRPGSSSSQSSSTLWSSAFVRSPGYGIYCPTRSVQTLAISSAAPLCPGRTTTTSRLPNVGLHPSALRQ